jgi:formamidopyrimidine-DNA glycosylase
MDQGRVAGLGNIHAAEALFRSRLHPSRAPSSLTPAEWQRLRDAIMTSIQFALDAQPVGEDIEYVEEPGAENPFLVYGRDGAPCTVCGTTVESFDQGGRTTHVCPKCQPSAGVMAKGGAPKAKSPAKAGAAKSPKSPKTKAKKARS